MILFRFSCYQKILLVILSYSGNGQIHAIDSFSRHKVLHILPGSIEHLNNVLELKELLNVSLRYVDLMCAKSVSIVGFNNRPEEYACLSLFCFGEKLLKTKHF